MKSIHPVIALLALGLAASAAMATVVVALDLAGLALGSEVILEGQVLATRAELDRRGSVATRVVVSVTRDFKGTHGAATFSFAVPGGELGERGLVIAGMPRFAVGEELVLFLSEETHRGIRMPTGMGQGKLVLERDPTTGARSLQRDFDGLQLVDGATGRALPPRTAERLPYERFVNDLAAIVERQEAGR